MTKETVIPHLGQLLRALIKAGGYRGFLVERGLDKNLDDLAGEAKGRHSTAFELMQGIDDACCKALAEDCGHEWAQLFRQAWFRTREAIQGLVQQVDASLLPPEAGRELFLRQFTIPMLSGFMQLTARLRDGGDAETWLSKPLQAWLVLAARRSRTAEQGLLAKLTEVLDADPRTMARWLSGDPIGKLSWPYATKVATVLDKKQADSDVQFLSGWLLVACAIQSVSPEIRAAVQRDVVLRKQQPWALEHAVAKMNQEGDRLGHSAVTILNEVQHCFEMKSRNDDRLQSLLDQFKRLIERLPSVQQSAYRYIHDWFSARHAALLGNRKTALGLYACALSGAWWRAGPNQHPILNEALIYAVGVGEKDAANVYWDRTFMLGLNRGPKRPLNEQERRRIAFAFEQRFHPLKAKDRIPPAFEFKSHDDAFCLSRKYLANPDRKTKYAEGHTRRTPLMLAIQEGTLDEVKQLIAAGGDPNDFIPESGEGPLSWAMRRACDRKDTAIMDYLLGFELHPETVNRPASTIRETPLKIAIEMANASAVARLIELGADVEAACDYLPSALCYAMTMFHGSLHRDDPTQEDGFFAGKSPADVYDAKEGTVLDVDLAARRKHLRDSVNASNRHRQIFKDVLDYFIRSPADHRKVVQALMDGGADANRRYRVEAHHLAEWTPTLFAAQVGDLAVFKMLVEHTGEKRGDPQLTLMPSGKLACFDALWVAIDHGRHPIVSYLMKRERG
ncbi:ankyrin repeat domain-containing protein [Microvirgula aerodenitrificans]|uniref:ankyrin repeat domain-containing protein n=1 Tax=Microvirgula aerodenitrificans TaxID=57480 RepID=UPI0028E3687C|nr:ankyrin repeat domain-containing protein [Microvirgula aerodenitrificans]